MNLDMLEDYGIGVLGLVFGLVYWFIEYLLHKENDEKRFLTSFRAAAIAVGIYLVVTRFLFNGFEEENWEDTKRFVILISLLMAIDQLNIILKNTKTPKIKNAFNLLMWLAGVYAIVIPIGVVFNIEQLLNIIEIINDLWGMVITLYTAFLIYVLRRNSNNVGGQ